MLNANHSAVFNLAQDAAPGLPVAQRIKVYRGLADLVGSESEARLFLAMAEALENAEHRCAELKFTFNPEGK